MADTKLERAAPGWRDLLRLFAGGAPPEPEAPGPSTKLSTALDVMGVGMMTAPPALVKAFLPGASAASRAAIREQVVTPMTRMFKRGTPVRQAQARGLKAGVAYSEPEKLTYWEGLAAGEAGPALQRPDVDFVAPSPVRAPQRRVEVLKGVAEDPTGGPLLRRHEFSHVAYRNLSKDIQETVKEATLSGELPIHPQVVMHPRLYGKATSGALADENYAYWMADYLSGKMAETTSKGGLQSQAAMRFFADKLGGLQQVQPLAFHPATQRTYQDVLGAFVGDPDIRLMWPYP